MSQVWNEAIRDKILEAIDLLRNRKARPDIKRISNYLFRRYKVSSADAKAGLDWCVDNNFVLRVEYKGNISYRNAAKKKAMTRKRPAQFFTHQNKYASSKLSANRDFMELLTNVFGELVVEEPDYLENGVPPHEIMDKILSRDGVKYARRHAAILLVEEVQKGHLVKLENGNFILGPCQEKPKPAVRKYRLKAKITKEVVPTEQVKPKKLIVKKKLALVRKNKTENLVAAVGNEEGASQRSGRRKKARQVFDPSDTHIPKKRGRPTIATKNTLVVKKPKRCIQITTSDSPETSKKLDSVSPKKTDSRRLLASLKDANSRSRFFNEDLSGVCGICFAQSKKDPQDRMVACRECSYKAHYGCLKNEDMIIDNLSPNTPWRCPDCKTCRHCFETSKAGDLIGCTVCGDAYHATCHQPKITEKIPKGQKWLCVYCQATEEMKSAKIDFGKNISKRSDKQSTTSSSSPSKIDSGSSSSSNSPSSSVSNRDSESDSSSDKDSDDENDSSDDDSESSSSENETEKKEIDPSIPDATNWTPDEVYQYFRNIVTEEEARVFKEQEIDGRSCLLLRRIDVISHLNLMLSSALKVYRHVTMLQVRRDDKSLYWL